MPVVEMGVVEVLDFEDFDAAVFETLGLEVRHVFGVKRRKTVITRRTMEKHHVAEHSLSC